MFNLTDFSALQIGLASPEKILEWSHGEVKKPETINYRTLKPERDGLFCERIFGPTKDWECHCGRYKRGRYKGIVCEKCGVEVTRAKVRRERMGHIELAVPVSHIWYFKGIPCRLKLLLDMSPKELEQVLYFASYVVTDPGETPLAYKQVISDREYHDYREKFGPKSFKAGMGAEAIRELLCDLDLVKLEESLKKEVASCSGQKRLNAIKRLEVIEAFLKSGNRPEWIILTVLPVIPPELRPMVQLDGGRFATSDLNDLYRRVINRNNRLKRLLELRTPEIIVRNEKRMLQEAVDALIDNSRRKRPVTGPGNRPLKSLSDMLRGKQGRFRQNLLGKRVDYSGRSVIVVGPELKMYQCGLPKEMALELFKPFVMKKLVKSNMAQNVKGAKRMIERGVTEVWGVLEGIIKEHPVMLNRAPTLHRLGIQAFEPVLVEGRAIKLHPLVCTAFNADFDGDQMAVHVPLSVEAQSEARFLMLAANNILKPQDGKPVVGPTHDMVLGCYYLTLVREGAKGEGKAFSSEDEALMAYQMGEVTLQSKVKVRLSREYAGVTYRKIVDATVGKIIFNNAIPQDLGFVERNNADDMFRFEIDKLVTKSDLGKIVDRCYRKHGPTVTSEVLDRIKSLGFHYSTVGGISVGFQDIIIPEAKKQLIAAAEEEVEGITDEFRMGLLSNNERRARVIGVWERVTQQVSDALMASFDKFNPIDMMAKSGARGSTSQIRQLAGMRGLMSDPSGQTIEVPIRSNFREGLSVLEFFVSSHGTRKGLADTALRTADSGYLTRRLVDVSQDIIVREKDCFAARHEAPKGMVVSLDNGYADDHKEQKLAERLRGRYTIDAVVNPKTGEVIVPADSLISFEQSEAIIAAGVTAVLCRSVFTCRSEHGVCAKCYGANMATGGPVEIGEAVGIIAAQAIGEPGTQLTMRTFHTGGVATSEDITQGLPRVEELFEARTPKGVAVITEIAGKIRIDEAKRRCIVTAGDGESESYLIPFGSRLKVVEGDEVEAGEELTEGNVNPNEILKIKGVKGVQTFLLREVQKVYNSQGVDIADKHIEVIIRQMLRKVQVEDAGDTEMLPGELCDIFTFEAANDELIRRYEEQLAAAQENGSPEPPEPKLATSKRKLMGITKASLATESFLSAASFQETTRVLTEAAIKGKVDPLVGLKENVIIGKLIPAGVGLRRYRDVQLTESETVPTNPTIVEIQE
ncbi:MAG TPA: DNA-directed RNA polymerase subunit beta' [Eubacteriales bacterium]|nr:DNA-directed RNA polymerase subunit beta' [Clostridia bacterium]HRV73234.1 DNA-directed RNA polymerase subunit beta' [Eubacteriales bacterium]